MESDYDPLGPATVRVRSVESDDDPLGPSTVRALTPFQDRLETEEYRSALDAVKGHRIGSRSGSAWSSRVLSTKAVNRLTSYDPKFYWPNLRPDLESAQRFIDDEVLLTSDDDVSNRCEPGLWYYNNNAGRAAFCFAAKPRKGKRHVATSSGDKAEEQFYKSVRRQVSRKRKRQRDFDAASSSRKKTEKADIPSAEKDRVLAEPSGLTALPLVSLDFCMARDAVPTFDSHEFSHTATQPSAVENSSSLDVQVAAEQPDENHASPFHALHGIGAPLLDEQSDGGPALCFLKVAIQDAMKDTLLRFPSPCLRQGHGEALPDTRRTKETLDAKSYSDDPHFLKAATSALAVPVVRAIVSLLEDIIDDGTRYSRRKPGTWESVIEKCLKGSYFPKSVVEETQGVLRSVLKRIPHKLPRHRIHALKTIIWNTLVPMAQAYPLNEFFARVDDRAREIDWRPPYGAYTEMELKLFLQHYDLPELVAFLSMPELLKAINIVAEAGVKVPPSVTLEPLEYLPPSLTACLPLKQPDSTAALIAHSALERTQRTMHSEQGGRANKDDEGDEGDEGVGASSDTHAALHTMVGREVFGGRKCVWCEKRVGPEEQQPNEEGESTSSVSAAEATIAKKTPAWCDSCTLWKAQVIQRELVADRLALHLFESDANELYKGRPPSEKEKKSRSSRRLLPSASLVASRPRFPSRQGLPSHEQRSSDSACAAVVHHPPLPDLPLIDPTWSPRDISALSPQWRVCYLLGAHPAKWMWKWTARRVLTEGPRCERCQLRLTDAVSMAMTCTSVAQQLASSSSSSSSNSNASSTSFEALPTLASAPPSTLLPIGDGELGPHGGGGGGGGGSASSSLDSRQVPISRLCPRCDQLQKDLLPARGSPSSSTKH